MKDQSGPQISRGRGVGCGQQPHVHRPVAGEIGHMQGESGNGTSQEEVGSDL